MKLFIPKQHGAWAMVIIPFWLGVCASTFVWQHIPFFIGWLFLYLATYPMLYLFKKKKKSFYVKWTIIYMIPALILLIIPLWTKPTIIYFALAMIPLFIINAYYSKTNNERALVNDFSAIITFSIASLASSYLGEGMISELAITAFVAAVLFFVCSTFYVKSMIREKRNKNFKFFSWGIHSVILLYWLIVGEWLIALAFVPSLIRAIVLYGKPIKINTLGVVEIVNAVWFFIWMIVAMNFS